MTSLIRGLCWIAISGSMIAGCNDQVVIPEPELTLPVRYRISFIGDSVLVVHPRDFVLVELQVDRDPDFHGLISFDAEFPPGLAAVFRPPQVISRTYTQLILVPADEIERTTHRIRIESSAVDAAPQSVTLTLTVADG